MSSVKKIYLAVAGGLVATGLVLAAIGFVASGFNLAVFNTQIDLRDDTIILGSVEIDDPTGFRSSSSLPRSARSILDLQRLVRLLLANDRARSSHPLRAHHDGREHAALGAF